MKLYVCQYPSTAPLLILDNADDLELIYDYLVPGNGHILVTTRSSATGLHIDGIELVKMDQEDLPHALI